MAAGTALSPAWPLDAELDERGRLRIGGCDAVALAEEHGTPLYVLAEEDLRARARAYRRALEAAHVGPALVLYAVKALPVGAVVRIMAEEGLGALCSSLGELLLAVRAGVDPDLIALHGNAKSEPELAAAVDQRIGLVIVDSVHDLDKLERVMAARPRREQSVLLRVTPGVEVDTHASIATGQDESKFGTALGEAAEVIRRIRESPQLTLSGLHAHIGSHLFDLAGWEREVEALAPLGEFPVYDLGGGLGATYTADDIPPLIEDHCATAAGALRERIGTERTLILEPGRALVANAGVTLYRVESIKRNVKTWVAVDGGMSDNLRPMLYGARYECAVADRFATTERPGDVCELVGKHCESGDVLIHGASLVDPRVGDVVATPATGAYGHAMASNYNLLPRPAMVLCSGGRSRVAVRRETIDDLFRRDRDL